MAVGEADSTLSQLIKMRCGGFGFGIVASEVSVSKVIGEDDDNVGPLRSRGPMKKSRYKKEREREFSLGFGVV